MTLRSVGLIRNCNLLPSFFVSINCAVARSINDISSDVNKDLTSKDKDQTLKAKDQDKDQIPKDKDQTFKPKDKD